METYHYSFPVFITNNRKIYCKELKNIHYKNIIKFIENNDDIGLCNFFEKIVEELSNGENLNYIDKFLILLSLRMVCVNKMLVLESSSQIKSSISLEDIIKKIIENFTPNLRTLQCMKDIEIIIGYPNTIKSKDNIFDKIHSININGSNVTFANISNKEKDEILSLLPASVAQEIYKELIKDESFKEIKLFSFYLQEGIEQEYFFSYDSKRNFELLKSLYSDSLKNLYYYEYICSYKLHIPLNDYLYNMTPVETILQIKTLTNELESQNKAAKASNQKSSTPPPGLGSPR